MSVISNDLGKRIQWIDVLRGYGMILIALGHAVLGLMSANLIDANSVGRDVVIFIYLFHMPIIFFVSGLVSSDAAKSMRSFVYSVGMWIALPYVVWSIILVLVQNALPGANSPIPFGDLAYMLWAPVSIFWFLHSLFVIKVADYATVKIIKSPFVAVALLAMAGVAGFVFGVSRPLLAFISIVLDVYVRKGCFII